MQISSAVDTEGAGLKSRICITAIVPLTKGIAEEVDKTGNSVINNNSICFLAEREPSDS